MTSAAIKAAVLNILSIGAAYGVIVAIFEWGWAKSAIGLQSTLPIPAYVPMLVFCIVFGLSMDYEVFLLSRVHEAWLATGDAHRSVAPVGRDGRNRGRNGGRTRPDALTIPAGAGLTQRGGQADLRDDYLGRRRLWA